jgi:hypothetical protein
VVVPKRPGPDADLITKLKWWRWCVLCRFAGMPIEGLEAAAARPTPAILPRTPRQDPRFNVAQLAVGSGNLEEDPTPLQIQTPK